MICIACCVFLPGFSQTLKSDSALKVLNLKQDSVLRANKFTKEKKLADELKQDSISIRKEYASKLNAEKLKPLVIFPLINAGPQSGVIPISFATEKPDPNIKYKLMFELVSKNPDSLMNEIDGGLVEIARVINLHYASGVPVKNIIPLIVVHGPALAAISTNKYYNDNFKIDNPNLKVIEDLSKLGGKFIACGQAMAFFEFKQDELLPLVKVSLTAQTVLSSYRFKGYIKYW